MKRLLKLFMALLFGTIILFQLIPKANKNNGKLTGGISIDVAHVVPKHVDSIFQRSCYDCHSNHTNYPWYTKFQPISLWVNHHVNEGKEELNFSEFGTYPVRRKYHKLREIIEQVEENEMPLTSYTLIHQKAKLSPEEIEIVKGWAKSLIDSIEHVYPADSLTRKRRD